MCPTRKNYEYFPSKQVNQIINIADVDQCHSVTPAPQPYYKSQNKDVPSPYSEVVL